MNLIAACCATVIRFGSTSVEHIEPEVSKASMIVVEFDATGTVACGRAAPRPRVAMPITSRAARDPARPAGPAGQRRPHHGDRGDADRRLTTPAAGPPGDPENYRNQQERQQRPRPAERHQTSLPVRSTVRTAPAPSSASANAMKAPASGTSSSDTVSRRLSEEAMPLSSPASDGGVVRAAGGLRDGGERVRVQRGVHLVPLDLDGRCRPRCLPRPRRCAPRRSARPSRPTSAAPSCPRSSPSENSTMVAEPQ